MGAIILPKINLKLFKPVRFWLHSKGKTTQARLSCQKPIGLLGIYRMSKIWPGLRGRTCYKFRLVLDLALQLPKRCQSSVLCIPANQPTCLYYAFPSSFSHRFAQLPPPYTHTLLSFSSSFQADEVCNDGLICLSFTSLSLQWSMSTCCCLIGAAPLNISASDF